MLLALTCVVPVFVFCIFYGISTRCRSGDGGEQQVGVGVKTLVSGMAAAGTMVGLKVLERGRGGGEYKRGREVGGGGIRGG